MKMPMGEDFKNRLKDGAPLCADCDHRVDYVDVITGLCEDCHAEYAEHLIEDEDPRNEYTFVRDSLLV